MPLPPLTQMLILLLPLYENSIIQLRITEAVTNELMIPINLLLLCKYCTSCANRLCFLSTFITNVHPFYKALVSKNPSLFGGCFWTQFLAIHFLTCRCCMLSFSTFLKPLVVYRREEFLTLKLRQTF